LGISLPARGIPQSRRRRDRVPQRWPRLVIMSAVNVRRLLATVIIVTGLVLAAAGIYVGWELPLREGCSGDTGGRALPTAWCRVERGMPPQRVGCGVAHADEGDVVAGPGEGCVTSSGAGSTAVTYEELRSRATQRRVLSLIVV